jgi:hypothetical protein
MKPATSYGCVMKALVILSAGLYGFLWAAQQATLPGRIEKEGVVIYGSSPPPAACTQGKTFSESIYAETLPVDKTIDLAVKRVKQERGRAGQVIARPGRMTQFRGVSWMIDVVVLSCPPQEK